MNSLLALLILSWNKILGMIARPFGLFFGGLVVGFLKGIQDQKDMAQYLRYKAHLIEKRRKGNVKESDKDKRS